MVGSYAMLLVLVALTSVTAWIASRRRIAGSEVAGVGLPSPRLFPFAACAAVLAVAIGLIIAWAPSVSAVSCTEAMMASGRCRASSLAGASGLMLFLCPLGVALAYLWSEGILEPAAHAEELASRPTDPAPPSASSPANAATVEPQPIPRDPRLLTATVNGTPTALNAAIDAATERLRNKQIALVFSGAASEQANLALAQLADALDAPRFLVAEDGPYADTARDAAGEQASHADELALALAGGLYQGVILVDARADFHELTLMGLSMVASVCLAEEPTPASLACAVVLPAASGEEAARARTGGELDGDRRPRTYLLTVLRRNLAPNWSPPSSPAAAEAADDPAAAPRVELAVDDEEA